MTKLQWCLYSHVFIPALRNRCKRHLVVFFKLLNLVVVFKGSKKKSLGVHIVKIINDGRRKN